MHCPICDKTFEPEETTAMPFCSERCRLIDLGRWLGEGYSLSTERDEDESSASDGEDSWQSE
jgi:endogenous inhibitor of DNA gyrase (YacG/DUF329 family)